MNGIGKQISLMLLLFLFVIMSGVLPATVGAQALPCHTLTQAEVEQILGLPVRLTQNDSGVEGDLRKCQLKYTGLAKDPASGQEIILYFSLEQKASAASAEQARQVLKTIREENAHDLSPQNLPGIGDEAVLRTLICLNRAIGHP